MIAPLRRAAPFALLVGAALLIGAACGPRRPPSPPGRTRLGLEISSFRLANNGLRVVLVPDPRETQVQVAMHYQVGAIDDPAGREGMAHLAEHLMFEQRTGAHDQSLFARSENTASWFNAYTRLDSTMYIARGDPARLADLLEIEGHRLVLRCRTITPEVFAREREVVRNELRERGDQLTTALQTSLYPAGHPYHRSVSGTDDSVARITFEEACAFIDAHYSPDNAVLVVSGGVTAEQLEAALGRLLGRVPPRPIAPRTPVAPPRALARSVRSVPIDEPALVIAWALPDDPVLRSQLRAIAWMIQGEVSGQIAGTVGVHEIGGARAPLLALAIDPGANETVDDALRGAELAIDRIGLWFGQASFVQARERAAYKLMTRFEDGPTRAITLAGHVLAGRDAMGGVRAEVQGLTTLSAEQARTLAREYLAVSRATILTLAPEGEKAATARRLASAARAANGGIPADLDRGVHAIGGRQAAVDPAEAHAPAANPRARDPFDSLRAYQLPNGLSIVLMPFSSVPTVDIRLVFGAGHADEPAGARGTALLAGHGLAPAADDLGEYLRFYLTGGRLDVAVETDRTTFSVRGLDMHVDALLGGLERLVRHGTYDVLATSLRQIAAKRGDQPRDRTTSQVEAAKDAAAIDAWWSALYGVDHPYARTGALDVQRLGALDGAAVRSFRAAHYTPRNATLIVAGGFDRALAERWIEYLFADWSGRAATRPKARGRLAPVSLARDQVAAPGGVDIALPLEGADRATGLIAAEMVRAAVFDVRNQLAASYGIEAQLVERRLATTRELAGQLAPDRAPEAMAMIRDRLARLATNDDAAAAQFVAARRRVIARLSAITASADDLAALAEIHTDLGRPVHADQLAAERARTLTLADLAPVLGSLDLARAAILLRGPEEAVARSFAALGRTPRVVAR
ncbi:MAG: M16 family metallopeptidase [Kofleriaceae bacterium]